MLGLSLSPSFQFFFPTCGPSCFSTFWTTHFLMNYRTTIDCSKSYIIAQEQRLVQMRFAGVWNSVWKVFIQNTKKSLELSKVSRISAKVFNNPLIVLVFVLFLIIQNPRAMFCEVPNITLCPAL